MGRSTNVKSGLVATGTICALVAGLSAAIYLVSSGRPLMLANILIPLMTLVVLWIIRLRQRRLAKRAEELKQIADAYARMAALSDAIEDEYLSRRQKRPHDVTTIRLEDGETSREHRGPTIH